MSTVDEPRVRSIRLAAVLAACCAAAPADAASDVSVELNRMEPVNASCRMSLVVANARDKALDSLKLDLVIFGKDGVIARRLIVEAGPLRPSKTTVKLFDATDTACDGVGKILLNDVTACGGEQDCLSVLSISSRVKGVEFAK